MKTNLKDYDEQETRAASMLAALGNENRLRIYRLLVRAGPEGLNVGDVQERLGIPASTLSHHIAALRHADLVGQHREGRVIINSAKYDNMDELINYLTEECCVDAENGEKL
jgi:DNA-binding transcriptional ArsR family regulator